MAFIFQETKCFIDAYAKGYSQDIQKQQQSVTLYDKKDQTSIEVHTEVGLTM